MVLPIISLTISVFAIIVSVISVFVNNKNAKLPYRKEIDFVFMPKIIDGYITDITCVINNKGNKVFTYTSCYLTGDNMNSFIMQYRDNGDELEFPCPIEIDCSVVFHFDTEDFYTKVVEFAKNNSHKKLNSPIILTLMDFVYYESNFSIGLTYEEVLNLKFKPNFNTKKISKKCKK